MASLVRDDRGLSVIETALYLPLVLLIVVAGFQVWKLTMVERDLHVGAYQAARHLANNPDMFLKGNSPGYRDYIERRVRVFVEAELDHTRFGRSLGLDPGRVEVAFNYTDGARCTTDRGGHEVTVSAIVAIEAPTRWLEPLYDWPVRLRGVSKYDPCFDLP